MKLKALAIFAVLLVVIAGACSQVPRDRSPQNQKPQARSDPSQTLPASVNAQIASTEKKKGTDPQPYEYPWRELYGPTNLPNWFLVLIGGCGVLAAVRSLRVIGLQTNLMKEQLDRMVERERARLNLELQVINIDDSIPDTVLLACCIEITNSGQSNAYIRFGAIKFVAVKAGQWPLPEADPEEFTGIGTIPPSESPHYVDPFMEFDAVEFHAFIEEVADATLRIRFYGFIEYESLGISWHRDFGYIWTAEDHIRDENAMTFRHPKAGKLHFRGGWEPDVRQKNTEYQLKPK